MLLSLLYENRRMSNIHAMKYLSSSTSQTNSSRVLNKVVMKPLNQDHGVCV